MDNQELLAGVTAINKGLVNRCVIRLTTTSWADKNGIYSKQSLKYLHRQCAGFNLLAEDASMLAVAEITPRILNLSACPDGVYQVITCNEKTDYETGYVEDYDYKLIPYATEQDISYG